MLYHYSILPLSDYEMKKRIEDIVNDAKGPSKLFPLFMMTLVPEGNPVWDKVGTLCKIYAQYRDALLAEGVESGILVQASLGHGYPIERSSFSPFVRFSDGGEESVYCPMGEEFLAHFAKVFRTLAKEHPKAIMLDDDFRLMVNRRGNGCACPMHMAEFNRRANTNMTREQLYRHVASHPKTDPLARIFAQTQQDALINAAKVFRAAIDEIDPTILGIICTSGCQCESAIYTAPIFAGKGNPTIVRMGNGIYYPESNRKFSNCMRYGKIGHSKLRKNGIDVILAETDTIPFNRYAKSARYLHSHYTASLLEGLQGAKHWVTRLYAHEPDSSKAYRKILAQHAGMYERLSQFSQELSPLGANSLFLEQTDYDFSSDKLPSPHTKHWSNWILERMGLPFYFDEALGSTNLLEGEMVNELSDEQIEALFETNLWLDGQAAHLLCQRGFGKYLGVDVKPWSLGVISEECFRENPHQRCKSQPQPYQLEVTDNKTEVLTHLTRWDGPLHQKLLAPSSTCFPRENNKYTAVFCGTVASSFSFAQATSYLNESRKADFVSLLQKMGSLPVYLVGDDEVCLRAAHLKDGRLLVSLYDLGTDPVEELVLYLEKEPRAITYLLPDGSEQAIPFQALGEDRYQLEHTLETLYPLILLIS